MGKGSITKARSKAGKLRTKRRRGRPKFEGIRRQPNGKPSRAKNPPDNTSLEVRARLTGLSLEEARDPRSATNLGRLVLLNEREPGRGITADQYDAVVKYLYVVNEYKQAICSPGAVWDKGVIVLGGNDDEYTKWCKQAIKRYDEANKAIAKGQRDNPNAHFAIIIKHVILRDIAMSHYMASLRLLCDILHAHFNPGKKASFVEKSYK
ncbi:hypothetical protein BAnh1_09700 [Bartonella australis AUST/NH1]|uniref:Uncharacterized protein n=1 Tax=Bartonella australis (strain Aust/NH1) TaxID=1094489 RepID=M1NZI7_BARAA|nr:hypothetical protein [Bartonella australis]AGF74842.1 hypothetical protein BAnh1_09700 [Bartonella australis AUST/NH1]